MISWRAFGLLVKIDSFRVCSITRWETSIVFTIALHCIYSSKDNRPPPRIPETVYCTDTEGKHVNQQSSLEHKLLFPSAWSRAVYPRQPICSFPADAGAAASSGSGWAFRGGPLCLFIMTNTANEGWKKQQEMLMEYTRSKSQPALRLLVFYTGRVRFTHWGSASDNSFWLLRR